MIYVHKLKDLNPKNAEIESVQIIREIKRNKEFLSSESVLKNKLDNFFITNFEKEAIKNSIMLIEPTVNEIKSIIARNDGLYEPINLQRAVNMLESLPLPLVNNITYIDGILEWRDMFFKESFFLLANIPKLKTNDEKTEFNKRLSAIFEKLLRHNEFYFNSEDIVGEREVEVINALDESVKNGFFFHFSLEEELKKLKFEQIKYRIPLVEIQRVEEIAKKISLIRHGVDIAYNNNMKMVNVAIILYSYVKIMLGG